MRKAFDCIVILRLCGVRPELAVDLLPGEAQRTFQREGPVGDPLVEIKAQRRTFDGFEDVYIQRHRVQDDFIKEFLAQLDLALP